MFGREPGESVLRVERRETSKRRYEREEEVLDDEAPGQEADDRADLARHDCADPDAERAPESHSAGCSDQHERRLPEVQRNVDAASGEGRVANPESQALADGAEG